MNKKEFIVRLVFYDKRSMVSICDEEIIGKNVRFNSGIDIHISKEYFGNERLNLDESLNLVRKCQIVNLVGNRIVEKVIQDGLANSMAVKKVNSISFLMIYKFNL